MASPSAASSGSVPSKIERIEKATNHLLGCEPITQAMLNDTRIMALTIRTNRIDIMSIRHRMPPEDYAVLLLRFFPAYLQEQDLVALAGYIDHAIEISSAATQRVLDGETVDIPVSCNSGSLLYILRGFFISECELENVLHLIGMISANYNIIRACISQVTRIYINDMHSNVLIFNKFYPPGTAANRNSEIAQLVVTCQEELLLNISVIPAFAQVNIFMKIINALSKEVQPSRSAGEESKEDIESNSITESLTVSVDALLNKYSEYLPSALLTSYRMNSNNNIYEPIEGLNMCSAIRTHIPLLRAIASVTGGSTKWLNLYEFKEDKALMKTVYTLSTNIGRRHILSENISTNFKGSQYLIDLAISEGDAGFIKDILQNDKKPDCCLLTLLKMMFSLILSDVHISFDEALAKIKEDTQSHGRTLTPEFDIGRGDYYEGDYKKGDEEDFIDLLSRDGWLAEDLYKACMLFSNSPRICYFAVSKKHLCITLENYNKISFTQHHYATQLATVQQLMTEPSELCRFYYFVQNELPSLATLSLLATSSLADSLVENGMKNDKHAVWVILPFYPSGTRERILLATYGNSMDIVPDMTREFMWLLRIFINITQFNSNNTLIDDMAVFLINFTSTRTIIKRDDQNYMKVDTLQWLISNVRDHTSDTKLAIFYSHIHFCGARLVLSSIRSKLNPKLFMVLRHFNAVPMTNSKLPKEYIMNFNWKSNEIWEHFSSEVLLDIHDPIETGNVSGVDQGGLTVDLYNRIGKEVLYKFFNEEDGYFVLNSNVSPRECYLIGQLLARAVYVDTVSIAMDLHPSIIYTLCLPALSMLDSDILAELLYNPFEHPDWLEMITINSENDSENKKPLAVKIVNDMRVRFEDQQARFIELSSGFNEVYMYVCRNVKHPFEPKSCYPTPVPLWNALAGTKITPTRIMDLLKLNIHIQLEVIHTYKEDYTAALYASMQQLTATELSEFCRYWTGSYRPSGTITIDVYNREDEYIRSHTCVKSIDVAHQPYASVEVLTARLVGMIQRSVAQQLRQEADGHGFTLA